MPPVDAIIVFFVATVIMIASFIVIFRKRHRVPPKTIALKKNSIIENHDNGICDKAKIEEIDSQISIDNQDTSTNSEPSASEDIILPIPNISLNTEYKNRYEDINKPHIFYDSFLDLTSYKYPTIDLLDIDDFKESISTEELELNKLNIIAILNNYKIKIEKIKATVGPTITLYEITPSPGIRISKIKGLEGDIALSLSIAGTRVIGHIAGTNNIGIEVPNKNPAKVSMRSVLGSNQFQNSQMDLPIALGKSMANEAFIADLSKMPHLLLAGSTGIGKSIALQALIISLLYKKHPSQLKFILIDINQLEFPIFRKIERHFLAVLPNEADPIINTVAKLNNTLKAIFLEMDQRYNLLQNAEVNNLKDYNTKYSETALKGNQCHQSMPYIVIIIDEFADLVANNDKDIELIISRIGQRGRPVGVHLVIATQRPSVNIITGTIKANFSSRIAFKVSSSIDSKTILDNIGAEDLNENGDMLFSNGLDIIHLQGTFVKMSEIKAVTEFIGIQEGYATPMPLPYSNLYKPIYPAKVNTGLVDSMFDDAARLIVLYQQGSTSLIQRKLKLGYNRAMRIVDQLEAYGVVGPFEGSRAREVFYKDLSSLEQYLTYIKKK